MSRQRLGVLALLVVGTARLGPGPTRELSVYDEGAAVYVAERVASGEVPYRDFWTIYAPADFYLIAAVFKVFGPRLIAERYTWVLLEAALAVLVFALTRRAGATRVWS